MIIQIEPRFDGTAERATVVHSVPGRPALAVLLLPAEPWSAVELEGMAREVGQLVQTRMLKLAELGQ